MKEVEIENRSKNVENREEDFFMVDLMIDGKKIETGENPIISLSFWEDMEDQSQRALYRIRKNNSKINFDFNLSTMGMSEEQKEQAFRDYIKKKHPDFNDVDKLFDLVEAEVKEIELTGPNDNHPNPFLKFSLDSQMTKNFILCVVEKYLNANKEQGTNGKESE